MLKSKACLGFAIFISALILTGTGHCFSLEKTDFKGDLRLRYQYDQTERADGLSQRHRGIFRFRFGFKTLMNDRITIGTRLATGHTDPRSTNQTATNFFSTKDLRLDKAYVFWTVTDNLELMFGKYDKAFLIVDDLLWDSDITFEGASFTWGGDAARRTRPFLSGGSFFLNEDKTTSNDAYMFHIQPGIGLGSGHIAVETALAVYVFQHLKGSSPSDDISSGSNTRVDGKLKYDFDSINPVVVITYHFEPSDGKEYALNLNGNYVYNFDSNDVGYLFGITLGHPEVKEARSWQVYYNYRHLEGDAFPDVFPDSDFYGGATNTAGHEVIAEYGIVKNVHLGLDYYNTGQIEGDREPQDLLQLDCVFNF